MLNRIKYRMHRKGNLLLNLSFLLVVGLSSTTTHAQQVKNISLMETIDLAVKNSNQLKASLARKGQADATVREALDNRLPNASVSGSYLRVGSPSINLKTDAFKSGADSTGGGGKMPSVNQAFYGTMNVSYPIFSGGKIRYGIESAKYLQRAAQLDADNDKEGVVLNAVEAYINLFKADVTAKVVKENLIKSVKRDSVFSQFEQNGLLARNDLLKAELQTSNIELSLLDAEANLKLARVNMDLMLGLPESTMVNATEDFTNKFPLNTLPEYEQMAANQRKDISALSFRKKSATTSISSARSDLYPSIVLTGGYIAADIPHLLTITNAVNAGVGIKYNIGSLWKANAKIKQAKERESEIIAVQAQLDDAVKLEVNQSYENYLLAVKKVKVFEKAVAQAEENFRIAENKYNNSLLNTTDLLDANQLLLQSKINLAVGNADIMLAYCKLLETSGTLSTFKF